MRTSKASSMLTARWRGRTRAAYFAGEKKGGSEGETENQRKDKEGDALLKSSTDKVSAMFDWVAEQTPSSLRGATSSESSDDARASKDTESGRSFASKESRRIAVEKAKEGDDQDLKFDLERFYVALTRKLYDDGF